MADVSDQFWEDVVSDKSRYAFLIDESRPNKIGGQFAIFGLVAFRIGDLIDAQAEWYSLATNSELKGLFEADIKGQHLYGSIKKDELKPFRDYFEKWLLKSVRVFFLFTSQEHIKLNTKTSYGKIKFELSDGTFRHAGDELQAILNFIKAAANDLGIKEQKVEVVVDESEQNSYGFFEVGTVKTTQEFSEFNTVSGGQPARVQCPAKFRVTITPDQTPNFQHALLFPDVACCLANKYGLLDEGKSKVDKDLFHIREISVSKIIEASVNWNAGKRS